MNFKISFSNNDMYGFMNGGITTAEKSKHVICLLYEVDRLGNTKILRTVHLNMCFRSTLWLAEIKCCVILYRENIFYILTIFTAKYRTRLVNVNLNEVVVKYHESSQKTLCSYLFAFSSSHLQLKRKHKEKNKIKTRAKLNTKHSQTS